MEKNYIVESNIFSESVVIESVMMEWGHQALAWAPFF